MTDERKGRRKAGTLEEMRERCLHWIEDAQGRRVVAGSAYNRYILRPISVRLTRRFVKVGISANSVTFLMTLAGIVGIVCCVPHSALLTLAGALGFVLFDLLDAVDGEIARWNESSSTKGLYLDQASHLLVEYPSLAIPALHYYGIQHSDEYLVLAAIAVISGVMGRTLREMFFRINAEAGMSGVAPGPTQQTCERRSGSLFLTFCRFLKRTPITAFPITKARVVHILTIGAIVAAYQGVELLLVILAWFYAAYCTMRLIFEIPYFYRSRVVDVPHEKKVDDYRWPI